MKLLLTNIRIIDGRNPQPIDQAHVVIHGSRIEWIGHELPEGFEGTTIDCTGKTLMPGMIDTHVHLSGNCKPDLLERFTDPDAVVTMRAVHNARTTLLAGFTMVRNVGEKSYIDVHLAKSIASGETFGPRVITCGRGISIVGGHGTPAIREISGADDARLAVREHIKAGVDQIKIIASGGVLSRGTVPGAHQMTMDEMKAITDEAKAFFRRTCAHAHGTQAIRNCIEAGIDSIEHCSLPDDESLEKMVEKGTFLVPTFVSGEMINRHGLEAGIRAEVVDKSKRMAEEKKERFQRALQVGVRIAMGTDVSTPYNEHGKNALELQLMVDCGMKPMDAIISTTYNAAACCALEQETGSVEIGKLADLIVLPGDPLKDISLLQRSSEFDLILKEGEVVSARGSFLQL